MISIEELRIGNIVFNIKTSLPIRISGVSDEGYVLTRDENNSINQIQVVDINPIIMDSSLIQEIKNQGIVQQDIRNRHIFYFPGQTTTYFLVYDNDNDNFFMGMIDVKLPEGYRRLTRPFNEYHKFQNAFRTTLNIELKKLLF